MNVKYRTSLILQAIVPMFLFFCVWLGTGGWLSLTIAIIGTIQVISYGMWVRKEKLWNKVNRRHDQRTRVNAHYAGYIASWSMMICLVIGAALINYSYIPFDYKQLIAFTVMLGFILMLVIKDYRNFSE